MGYLLFFLVVECRDASCDDTFSFFKWSWDKGTEGMDGVLFGGERTGTDEKEQEQTRRDRNKEEHAIAT